MTVLFRLGVLIAGLASILAAQDVSSITFYPLPAPVDKDADPFSITVGPDGALWFTEPSGSKIGRITTSGVITEFPIPALYPNEVRWATPMGITAGPDGALWFTITDRPGIGRITISGVITEYPLPTAPWGLYKQPVMIATGPDGALWFTIRQMEGSKQSGAIGRITTGGQIAEYALPEVYQAPWDIAAGSDGAMWFANRGSIEGRIGRISTAGVVTNILQSDSVYAMTAGPDGAIWFQGCCANAWPGMYVGRMTTGGELSRYPGGAGHMEVYNSIAADPRGSLWMSGILNIGRSKTTGEFNPFYVPYDLSNGVVVGPDGAVWFTSIGSGGGPYISGKIGRLALASGYETPVSRVSSLPAIEPTANFEVQWSGNSTAKEFNVYFQEPQYGTWQPWLERTAANRATFQGRPGLSYSFFSIAYDTFGGGEKWKTAAEATTKVEGTLPTSHVAPLPAVQSRPNFEVQWTGNSASTSFDLYVSNNGGPFSAWLSGTTATRAPFQGARGNTYAFFSVAHDAYGSVEGMKTVAEATTKIAPAGDVNIDGAVNCADIAIVKASLGKSTGQAGFDSRADVVVDGRVDVRDLAFVAQKLPAGTKCP